MIKKINIALFIAFAALVAMKGLKMILPSHERTSRRSAAVVETGDVSKLAPRVYYSRWNGYAGEDPISNRNGILLDLVRAVFPKAKLVHVEVGADEIVRLLENDPMGVTVIYGDHPSFKNVPAAKTPLCWSGVALATMRTNHWEYKDVSSLDEICVGISEDYLDFPVMRKHYEKWKDDPRHVKLIPSECGVAGMVKMMAKKEIDAFTMSHMDLSMMQGMASAHSVQLLTTSGLIDKGDVLLHVSGKDPECTRAVIEDWEKGMKRITKSGQRHRIFSYYGFQE